MLVGTLRFGPSYMPSRDSPEQAIELLLERGYSACEIDFEKKFWMDREFAERLGERAREADGVIEPGAPFHIHFSDIDYANRNEKSHLPYGEGTLRADPLAEALTRFERPATVISESPDEQSNQTIKAVLSEEVAP